MEIEVKDADELLASRKSGEISASTFDLAWSEANQMIERISERRFGLLALGNIHRHLLLNEGKMIMANQLTKL